MQTPVYESVMDKQGDFELYHRRKLKEAGKDYGYDLLVGRARLEHKFDIDVSAGGEFTLGGPNIMHEVLPPTELTVTYCTEQLIESTTREVFAVPVGGDYQDRRKSDSMGPSQAQMLKSVNIVLDLVRNLPNA